MSDDNILEGTSPEAEGSAKTQTPEPKSTTPTDEVALARKRQAGAEAARQIEKARADALEAEVAKYREANQTAAEKDMTELARVTARLEQAEQEKLTLKESAQAEILNFKFPKSRAKLPRETDEATLAEIEALLAEDVEPDPGTPSRHNASRSSAGAQTAREESAADVAARLVSMPLGEDWG